MTQLLKLAIIGTGMIGGAVARAARRTGTVRSIVGLDRYPAHARTATQLGLVDEMVEVVPADTDLIVIAVPNEHIPDWIVALADHPGVVMDVGSVKGFIIQSVRKALGRLPANYVPCHPLAGSEKHGPEHAPQDLFRERLLILTPEPETAAAAVAAAERFWTGLGARLQVMTPGGHDTTLAATSHLPHLLAFAFMRSIADDELQFSGGGFADFTRIAASSPELWWQIFQLNREPLLTALDTFAAEVSVLRQVLEAGDQVRGIGLLEEAARRRRRL